ncbi:MAG TPA: hypothetical protein VKR59_12510 [Terriglobales bacterium]|nr:hypothetical protein [Terriglobales bacterium]
MSITESSEDKLSIVRMNAELRHAQLELLSAHCATHKLRLRFPAQLLARHGRRDVLRKSIETASALNEYYSSIEKQFPSEEAVAAPAPGPNESHLLLAMESVASFMRDQRDHYFPVAKALTAEQTGRLGSYFPADLLNRIKVVELQGARVSNPAFYPQMRALGFNNLPDFAHLNSLTFIDVLVFNEHMLERTLFHAMVHAAQYQVLGLERYTELFVRGFVDVRFHFLIPLEAHAFLLESRFARPNPDRFSVEDEVRLWAKQNRY